MNQNNGISDYAEYRDVIETMADAIEHAIEEYPEDYDDLSELVFEEVDSSQYIIYTHHNLDVLKHADTQPDEWKHLVEDGAGYQEVLQAMAFEAMRYDLYDELNDRNVEI